MAYRRDLNSGLIENRPTWSRMGKERRRAELLYTCEIHVNGRVVARTQGRRLPMSCPPHEGRLNRSSPYPPSRIRFEIDWTGSNNHGTLGSVSVRFPLTCSPSIWCRSAIRLASNASTSTCRDQSPIGSASLAAGGRRTHTGAVPFLVGSCSDALVPH